MSRNGSGTYTLPAGNPVVTGTTISSTWANNTLSDIASALTGSIASDGQTTPTANLPMGGYNHTNVANATVRTQYATAAQVEDGTLNYLTSVSGTNAITATAPVSMSAYVAGQTFRFIAAGANTGAVTLNLNAIGAKSVTRDGTTALVANDIVSGGVYQVVYDGTQFQLTNSSNASVQVSSFSAGTTGFTPNTATTGAITLGGTLNVANGGTGLTSLTAGYIPYGNGTSAFSSSSGLFFDGSNLGVGTSSPGGRLDVRTNTTGDTNINVQNDYSGAAYAANVNLITANTSGSYYSAVVAKNSAGTATWKIDGAGAADTFRISTGSGYTERMRIDSSGNVGIGTSSIYGKFQVKVATDANFAVDNHSGVARLDFFNDAASANVDAEIQSTSLKFLGASGTERMRIDSSGNVLVGTTSTTGSQSNVQPVVAGAFYSSNGTTASLGANAQTNFYNTSNQYAYFVHARGNTDAGYAAVWIVYDTSGGINAIKLGGHASLSIVQGAAGVMALKTTSGYAGQTYNYIVTSFGGY